MSEGFVDGVVAQGLHVHGAHEGGAVLQFLRAAFVHDHAVCRQRGALCGFLITGAQGVAGNFVITGMACRFAGEQLPFGADTRHVGLLLQVEALALCV